MEMYKKYFDVIDNDSIDLDHQKKEFKTLVISKLLPSVYKDLIQIFMDWLVK